MPLEAHRTALDSLLTKGWGVNPYLSKAERKINKPLLPPDHVRTWENADTKLYEAWFRNNRGDIHSGIFTSVESAAQWLLKQKPELNGVVL